MTVARRLKAEIHAATGLTASAGVAPNKFLAKIASGWQKPDGLTVIAPERVEHVPAGAAGRRAVGRRSGHREASCARAASTKLVDVRTADPALLREAVGSLADWLQQLARGIDDRPVVAELRAEVVGQREHVRARPDRPGRRFARRSPRWRATPPRWLDAARALRAHGHHQGALQRLHDDHPQPHRTRRRATKSAIVARALELLERTEAGRRAGAAARRQRAQPLRTRRGRREQGSGPATAVRATAAAGRSRLRRADAQP